MDKDTIQLLLLVWNRKEYTEMTLNSVLQNTSYPFQLHIVDNASDEPTASFLRAWVSAHPEVVRSFRRSATNDGLSIPTQAFWNQMKSEKRPWWGKIDNDILFSAGWLERLVEVMEKCPSVGVASVCHFPRDFEREVQKDPSVIKEINGVKVYPRSHVGGCGYLLRAKACFTGGDLDNRYGKIFGWTRYQEILNQKGLLTAYAYPLVPVQHLGEWNNQAIKNDEYEKYNEVIWEMRHGKRKK